tara:strand:- start:56 stop:202 length:147 start_codon:yes stop_codon:yes gene_type:complete
MNIRIIKLQIDALEAEAKLTNDTVKQQDIFDQVYDLKTLLKEIKDNNL